MKNEKFNYVIKQDLFGKKHKIIQVKSFMNPEKIYEVNPTERTCTCREFERNKNNLPCKHIKLILGIKDEDGFPISLLKSSVQKAVRRGDTRRALSASKSWLRRAPSDFFRRLAIIIMEDAILIPDYSRVVELANISARKSFVLTKEIEHFALTTVEQISKVDIRDYDFLSYCYGFKSINIIPFVSFDKLGNKESAITQALLRRSMSGGMKGDMAMLSFFTRIWAHRFKEKIITLRKLRNIYKNIPTKKSYDSISLKLTPDDIILEAVDFHCAPLLPILMSKQYVIDLIKKYYPNDVITVDERLKNVIWKMRSGICTKKDYFTHQPIDWMVKPFNNTPDVDRSRYEAIYKALEKEINQISIWFINKSK